MSAQRAKGRRPRGSLSPTAIVDAAKAFVEEQGLRSLSMAALARSMDVPVTSVHWHFRTRDDLVDALAERVVTELYDGLPPVDTTRPWDEELLRHGEALRQQVLRSPAYLALSLDQSHLMGRSGIRNLTAQIVDAETAMLVTAGLSPADAARVCHVCSVYVRGFTILELAAREQYQQPGARTASESGFDPAAFPTIGRVDLLAATWADPDREFRLGLELMVGGIKAILPKRRTSATRPPKSPPKKPSKAR
jgi:AcrR family transcriptional regulator